MLNFEYLLSISPASLKSKISKLKIQNSALLLALIPLPVMAQAPAQAPQQAARVSYDAAVQPSPLAQRLARCGEDATGIRARLQLILQHIAQDPATYHVDGFTVPNLDLIPITVEKGDGRHLGGAQWAANNSIVKFRMTFYTAPLPPADGPDGKLDRELTLTDTLVHELAHCFFYSRYPKLAKVTQGDPLIICEGHAIHAARTFIQRHYFGTTHMPLAFYERTFLSPRYTRLYRAFRARYTDPHGRILRPYIDAAELRHAPTGYTLRNRTQE